MQAAITATGRSLRVRLHEWTKPEHPWSLAEELFLIGRTR